MMNIDQIKQAIIDDQDNFPYTIKNIFPLFIASKNAKILIIGQAPGLKTQTKQVLFQDQSGERLRLWLNVSKKQFYDPNLFAILPMDFYFPGKKGSSDLPPRKGFAQKWHPSLIQEMPQIKLIILIGTYAVDYYLHDTKKKNLTETVKSFQTYLPDIIPLVHPSPLNNRWLVKNPWYLK